MDVIKNNKNIALSNKDISELVDKKCNIVIYRDLLNYNSLDELLEPYGACILLFESKPRYGHWCAIFKINDKEIEFFNPYGGYPDDSLKNIPLEFRKISGQYYPYLSYLMLKSPYELSYNEHKFQKHKNNVLTCGRHCVIRVLFKNLNLDEYFNLMKELSKKLKIDFDEVVTLLTMHIN